MQEANKNLRRSPTLARATEVAQALPADKVRVVKYLQGCDTDLPGCSGLKWATLKMRHQSTNDLLRQATYSSLILMAHAL